VHILGKQLAAGEKIDSMSARADRSPQHGIPFATNTALIRKRCQADKASSLTTSADPIGIYGGSFFSQGSANIQRCSLSTFGRTAAKHPCVKVNLRRPCS
jgi:hypothetical protein